MGAEPAVALRMMNQADREAEARRVLEVGPDASQDEVCAAFKQAALRAHRRKTLKTPRRRRSCIGGSEPPTSA